MSEATEVMDPRFDPKNLYNRYQMRIKVRDWLCGGHPKNKELIKAWVESTTGFKDDISAAIIAEHEAANVGDVQEKCWTTFPEDSNGPYIEGRAVKAMFRECFSVLKIFMEKRGSKQVFQHAFEVFDSEGKSTRIYPTSLEGRGTHESPIHVVTAQGPRTALRRMDYMVRPEFTFQLWVLRTDPAELRNISENMIAAAVNLAQNNGLGAARSQGHGKFDVLEFSPLDNVPVRKRK